jgi:hypothetical protein
VSVLRRHRRTLGARLPRDEPLSAPGPDLEPGVVVLLRQGAECHASASELQGHRMRCSCAHFAGPLLCRTRSDGDRAGWRGTRVGSKGANRCRGQRDSAGRRIRMDMGRPTLTNPPATRAIASCAHAKSAVRETRVLALRSCSQTFVSVTHPPARTGTLRAAVGGDLQFRPSIAFQQLLDSRLRLKCQVERPIHAR